MIKSLVRWGAAAGIFAATVLSTGGTQFKALALPNEQILKILNPVPVFTITDEQGVVLTLTVSGRENATSENNTEQTAVLVFISHQQAKDFINTQLKNENPELAEKVSVYISSLGEIVEQSQNNQDIKIAYIPTPESVTTAGVILEGEGRKYQGGVPLFFIKDKDSGAAISLGLKDNTQQVLPLFFEKDKLDNIVQQITNQEPNFASSILIEVIPLEQVIDTLHKDNSEELEKIEFVISNESQELIIQNFSNATPSGTP